MIMKTDDLLLSMGASLLDRQGVATLHQADLLALVNGEFCKIEMHLDLLDDWCRCFWFIRELYSADA